MQDTRTQVQVSAWADLIRQRFRDGGSLVTEIRHSVRRLKTECAVLFGEESKLSAHDFLIEPPHTWDSILEAFMQQSAEESDDAPTDFHSLESDLKDKWVDLIGLVHPEIKPFDRYPLAEQLYWVNHGVLPVTVECKTFPKVTLFQSIKSGVAGWFVRQTLAKWTRVPARNS